MQLLLHSRFLFACRPVAPTQINYSRVHVHGQNLLWKQNDTRITAAGPAVPSPLSKSTICHPVFHKCGTDSDPRSAVTPGSGDFSTKFGTYCYASDTVLKPCGTVTVALRWCHMGTTGLLFRADVGEIEVNDRPIFNLFNWINDENCVRVRARTPKLGICPTKSHRREWKVSVT